MLLDDLVHHRINSGGGKPPLTARAHDSILASNGLFKTTYFDLASGSARSEASGDVALRQGET
jgi:hypothetical protein